MSISSTRGRDPRSQSSAGLAAFGAALHPARVAARLDPGLSSATLSRMQKSPRLRQRLAELMLGDDAAVVVNGAWEPDLLFDQDPRRAALLAGGVWHGRSLLKLIARADLAILAERIGAEAQPFALRHLSHAVADETVADPERLAALVERDGHACLGAWLEDFPALARRRVLLRLPPGTAAENPSPKHREMAGPLLALVLARLGGQTA